jgi:hypothetical protein
MLADGSGSPIGQGVTSLLLIAAFLCGWLGVARLRNRGFARIPRSAGWGAMALCASAVVLAVVLPPIIQPAPSTVRPSTTARLQILSPRPGEVFHGRPASVGVRLRLTGGHIVAVSSQHLIPNTGHVHLYLDGGLISMTFGTTITIPVDPGAHHLRAQFVAVDHGPFSPPVETTVSFRVVA